MAANGNLIFQDTNKATFVGANSNVVIDTVNASFGVGVDVNGPTSNLHVVGNCFVSTDFTASTLSGNGSGLTALNATNVTTGTLDRNTTGSAATLTTPRSIGGVNFDGSADIVPTTFGAATFDTDTLVVDSVNDRIGIGTTTPDVKFQVEGTSSSHQKLTKLATWNIFHHRDDSSFEHLITYTDSDGQSYFDNRDNFMYVQIPAVGGETLYTSTVSGYNSGYFNARFRDLNGNKPNLAENTTYKVHAYSSRIDAFGTITTAGNVGIGVTSPSLHTHIKTNNTGTTDDGLLIENTYDLNNQKTVLRLGIGPDNYAQIDARTKPAGKTYLTFSTQSGTGSWGDRMTIDEVGKITSSHKAGFVVGNPNSGDGDDYSASSLDADWNAWVNIFNDAWVGNNSGWGTFWAGSAGAAYRKDAADTNPNEYVFVGGGNKRFTFELNNGNAYFDGTLSQSNYDYAEYFEWEDGNPDNEDRRGYSVVLRTGGKIMKATSDDEPTNIIGIVSGTSSIVGDAAGYDWHGKYEVDEWGTKVTDEVYQLTWTTEEGENHSYDEDRVPEGITVPENGVNRRLHNRERITPGYDDTVVYIPRDKRKEWCTVGLLGKVRLRDGCPTNPNWRYMKTIKGKELWLIR